MKPVKEVEHAVQVAWQATEQVARWEREVETARAELQQLEVGAGAAVVDAPETAAGLVEQMASARSRLSIAEAAVPEAQRRHRDAVSAACRAEADSMERQRGEALKALEAHEKRAGELLAALEKFTGAQHRRVTLDALLREAREAGDFGPVRMALPVAEQLRAPLQAIERRQRILRNVADGHSPFDGVADPAWDDLGECLRTGGIADLGWLSPEDQAKQEQTRQAQELADQEHMLADLEAEAEELEQVASGPGVLARGDAADRLPKVRKQMDSARSLLFSMRSARGLPLRPSSPARESA